MVIMQERTQGVRAQPPIAVAAGWFASLKRPIRRSRGRSGSNSSLPPAPGRLLARSAWDLSTSRWVPISRM